MMYNRQTNVTSSYPDITDSTGESSVILVGQLRVLERNTNTFLLRLESSRNSIFFQTLHFPLRPEGKHAIT